MRKKLAVSGNSLALVIERPILKMLGITRNTEVELTTDGRRIVIEPVVPPRPELQPEVDALRVFNELTNRYAMSMAQLAQLHSHGRHFRYMGEIECEITPELRLTMRRLHECLQHKRAGKSWDDAIAAALAAVPKDQRPMNQTASAIADARMTETQPQIT